MIWSKKFFAKVNKANKTALLPFQNRKTKSEKVFRVGIIGGGPKGVYAIERIASLWASSNTNKQLQLICFNTNESFGAGTNYNTEQPDYLLINYSLGNIDFWIDEPIQLVEERLNLVDFINKYKEECDAEAMPLDFCSRATAGIYIQYAFRKVIEALPSNIDLILQTEKVLDIEKLGDNYTVITDTQSYERFSELLFCTGHAYSAVDTNTQAYTEFGATSNKAKFVSHIYPVDKMKEIEYTSKTVLVQGLGLTFVDAVLALTEGLGGEFKAVGDRFIYQPSGHEPKRILPFSRTGLPMLPRKPGLKDELELKFFTKDFVREKFDQGEKIDFEEDVLPTLILEYRHQFVSKFLEEVGFVNQFKKMRLKLDELEQLVGFVFPEFHPFDFWGFIQPNSNQFQHHAYVQSYLEDGIYDDSRPFQKAINAMTAVWRVIHPFFNELYKFGKLKGESQRTFDCYYFGRLSRVSYGPPIYNMKKILALAESGILNFSYAKSPVIIPDKETDYFIVSRENDESEIRAEILIDARIPKGSCKASLPSVYQNLIDRYQLPFFQNEGYHPGCVEIDKLGKINKLPGITLNGTPTEGWTLDNESLSRNNNNFISPWAARIVNKYANSTTQIKTTSSFMD